MGALTVYVTHRSGQMASGVRVTGSVAMGGMIQDVRTDGQGKAVLTWSSNNSLDQIFVDGKGHRGPFRSGSTHQFSK